MKCEFSKCNNEVIGKSVKRFCCDGCRVKHHYSLHPKKKYNYDYRDRPEYYERKRKNRKAYYESHKNQEKNRMNKWRQKNRIKYNNITRKSITKARVEIKDSYVKDQLKEWGIENPSKYQIELYREQLKLKRKIYEKQRNTTDIN